MPVPLGETGQLYVSSKNLCDGYVGKNNNNFSINKVCTYTYYANIFKKLRTTYFYPISLHHIFVHEPYYIRPLFVDVESILSEKTFFSLHDVVQKLESFLFYLTFINFFLENYVTNQFFWLKNSLLKIFQFRKRKYVICNFCYITSQKNLLLLVHKNFDDVPSYKLLCKIGANHNFYNSLGGSLLSLKKCCTCTVITHFVCQFVPEYHTR